MNSYVRKLELEEVNTLGRMFKQRWIDCVSIKKDLKNCQVRRKVSQICESAGFMRKVSIGQHFRTIQGVNDGFGGKTGSCREFTLPRDQDSEPVGWISGRTRIGPVRQVETFCCLDQEGIEIQVPSTS